MKRLIVGVAAALILSAGPATADGLPSKGGVKAPKASAGPNWNGFYLGVGIGGGAMVADTPTYFPERKHGEIEVLSVEGSGSSVLDSREYGGDGIFGIVSIGYDRVIRPGWVGGVFFDYDFGSSISSSNYVLGLGPNAPYYYDPYHAGPFSIDHNSSWAVGARLGFLTSPGTLVYGAAGYTQAEFEASAYYLPGYRSPTFSGYFVGAGIESFLRDNWTLKLEYRYSDFGSETVFDGGGYLPNVDTDPSTHTARLVLSYKFGHRD